MESIKSPEKKANMEKRKPNGPIKFGVSLNEEQKQAKAKILNSVISILTGQAGSGKTMLACQIALDKLFKREIERIIITRATVAKEDIGFLPGNIKEKMDPWLSPIYSNLYRLYKKDAIDKMVEDGSIEILPIAFLRGRTFVDSAVIVDEAQNITHEQMEAVLTRIGLNSVVMVCGDTKQIDLKYKKDSGLHFVKKHMGAGVKGIEWIDLKTNHRHEIVEKIIEIYDQFRD